MNEIVSINLKGKFEEKKIIEEVERPSLSKKGKSSALGLNDELS